MTLAELLVHVPISQVWPNSAATVFAVAGVAGWALAKGSQ